MAAPAPADSEDMTTDSPYTSVPTAPRYGATPWTRALRWALVVVAGTVGLLCAAVSLFFAHIQYSGCFIGCNADDVDHPGGIALAVLAAALAATGPAVAAAVFRSRAFVQGSAWTFCVLAVLAVWTLVE